MKIVNYLNLIKFSNYIKILSVIRSYDDRRLHASKTQSNRSSLKIFFIIDAILGIITISFLVLLEILIIILINIKSLFTVNNDKEQKRLIKEYIKNYNCSYIAGIKMLEGIHFKAEELIRPAVEVGIATGSTSSLHFEGQNLDIGIEYLHSLIKKNKYNHWKSKLVTDFRSLPFKENSIGSIFSVHVVDHIPDDDLQNIVIPEINRALIQNGKFVFSGFAIGRKHLYFYNKLVRFLGFKRIADKFETKVMQIRCSYNLYNREFWEKIFKSKGLEITKYSTYGRSFETMLFYNMHHLIHQYTRHLKGYLFKIAPFKKLMVFLMSRCFRYAFQKDLKLKCDENKDLFFSIVAKKN